MPNSIHSYVLDTSFWISLINIDDSNHQKAVEIEKELGFLSGSQTIYFHISQISELFTVAHNKLGIASPEGVRDLVEPYLRDGLVTLNSYQLIDSYCSIGNTSLSFDDMIGVVLARHTHSTLLTFDTKQQTLFDSYAV